MRSIVIFFILIISCFSFVIAEDGEADTSFFINDYNCVKDVASAYWQSSINQLDIVWIYNSTYSSSGVCNNTFYGDSWCCPNGFMCVNGACITGSEGVGIISCSGIEDEYSCNSAPTELAVDLIEGFGDGYSGICFSGEYDPFADGNEKTCYNFTFCGCAWNDGCASELLQQTECLDGSSVNTTCDWLETSRDDKCGGTSGKITIRYTASGSAFGSDPLCIDQIKEYPCSVSVKLPFFDKFSFVFAGLAIMAIYFLMRRK